MIAPLLPRSDGLIEKLSGKVDHVLIDRLNYSYANRIYEKNNPQLLGPEAHMDRHEGRLPQLPEQNGQSQRQSQIEETG
jgi:hypothetical protein